MAGFCTKCGRPLTNGEVCSCTKVKAEAPKTYCTRCGKPLYAGETCDCASINGVEVIQNFTRKFNQEVSKNDMCNGTYYERGSKIVPDNINSNEGEIPVKQYDAAVLRSRIKFMRAEGRLQVTNKRLLFRATGRSLRGKTVLQHEFSIDELSGLEIKKDYRFSFIDLLLMIILMGICAIGVVTPIISGMWRGAWFLSSLFALALAVVSVIAAVIKRKKYMLNSVLLSSSAAGLLQLGFLSKMSNYNSWGHNVFSGFITFLAIVFVIAALVELYLHCYKPNLLIQIKTKGGLAPIVICGAKRGLLSGLGLGLNQESRLGV